MSHLPLKFRKRKERSCLNDSSTSVPVEDDSLAALVVAVENLSAGARKAQNKRDARVASRSRKLESEDVNLPSPSDDVHQLRDQLGALQDERHLLESQLKQPDSADIPFTGDMEQLLSRFKEITKREASVVRRLKVAGVDVEQLAPRCLQTRGRKTAASCLAELELAQEDALELADLREQKQVLQERLAKLAVWSPAGSPSARASGKRQCFSTVDRVRDWLRDDVYTSSVGASGASQGEHPAEGREALLLKAREALKATDCCLAGPRWGAVPRSTRNRGSQCSSQQDDCDL